jgi:hypothetical protein
MTLRIVFAIAACLTFGAFSLDQATQRGSQSVAKASAAPSGLDIEAMSALAHMIAHLRTLRAFEVVSETTTETADHSQRVLEGRAIYRVRNADAFFVDVQSNQGWRQFYYDRRTLTMYAPRRGYYAEIATPPNIPGALEVAADHYGIEMPLADLLSWGVANHELTRATNIGYAYVRGADTTEYAFREGQLEWRFWIASGAHPVPLRIAITDLADETRPAFTAQLSWDLHPQFTDEDFTFRPSADSRQIPINLVVADETRVRPVTWTHRNDQEDLVPISRSSRVGAIASALPASCAIAGPLGTTYYNCRGIWYEPRFAGSTITYVVINPPRRR